MTREQFINLINKIDWNAGYPWKHELTYLRDNDAEQREEITRLREALRQAISIANGLTNYVEDRPGLRDAERRLKQLEKQALTQEPQ